MSVKTSGGMLGRNGDAGGNGAIFVVGGTAEGGMEWMLVPGKVGRGTVRGWGWTVGVDGGCTVGVDG